MHPTPLLSSRWSARPLLGALLTAMLLAGSWFWPQTRVFWNLLDLAVFHTLNAPLASSPLWAHVWGIGNMRASDLAVAAVMLVALVRSDWFFSANQLRAALYTFLTLLLLLTVLRVGIVAQLLGTLEMHRSSPSLVVADAVRLSAMFPDWAAHWDMKDSSNRSFPADHAAVLLLWASVLWSCGAPGKRWQVLILGALFVMPRLVSGAHWASDILVGSVALCLFTHALARHTPLGGLLLNLLRALGEPLCRLLARVPLLRRLQVIANA